MNRGERSALGQRSAFRQSKKPTTALSMFRRLRSLSIILLLLLLRAPLAESRVLSTSGDDAAPIIGGANPHNKV